MQPSPPQINYHHMPGITRHYGPQSGVLYSKTPETLWPVAPSVVSSTQRLWRHYVVFFTHGGMPLRASRRRGISPLWRVESGTAYTLTRVPTSTFGWQHTRHLLQLFLVENVWKYRSMYPSVSADTVRKRHHHIVFICSRLPVMERGGADQSPVWTRIHCFRKSGTWP